jgi:hypothetical protein
VETLKVVKTFPLLGSPGKIEFSTDSKKLLCSFPKEGSAQVWSLHQPWSARVDAGRYGLVAARFAPDGEHVLVLAEGQVVFVCLLLADADMTSWG